MSLIHAREGETFSAYETFVIIVCYKCGIPFGVPGHWRTKRLSDKADFYCPNGHEQCYCKSTEDILREQLSATRQQVDRERLRVKEVQQQRDSVRKSHQRMRERVRNGVCPCCDQVFTNLLEHMRTEHPEYGINKTLRQLREAYGMTQDQLADELGVTTFHIFQFENDKKVINWAKTTIEEWIQEQGQD